MAFGLAGCQAGAARSPDRAALSPSPTLPAVVANSSPVKPATDPASASPTVPTAGAVVPVTIKLFSFDPSPVTIPVGATVTWTNQDSIIHSVTQRPGETPGGFDSDFFDEGQSFSRTFEQPGEYAYFCRRHTFMEGVIKVVPSP